MRDNPEEIERRIISTSLGEGSFELVKFLRKEDFSSKSYAEMFSIMKKSHEEGSVLKSYLDNSFLELCKQNDLTTDLASYSNIQYLAVLLSELSFKRLLLNLLGKLSLASKNRLEVDLLNELNVEVSRRDIFDMNEILIEYLGVHASENTLTRINQYLDYVKDRILEIKRIVNG